MPTEEDVQPKRAFILVQQKHRGKEAVKVIKVNCSQIVFEDKDGQVHRQELNSSKKIPEPINPIPIHDQIHNHLSAANPPLIPTPQQQNPIIQTPTG